jgi:hypothetical protein
MARIDDALIHQPTGRPTYKRTPTDKRNTSAAV